MATLQQIKTTHAFLRRVACQIWSMKVLKCRLSYLVVTCFLFDNAILGQEPNKDQTRGPVIATSGRVEIASIRIARQVVSDAAKEADLTNMRIELWLTRKAENGRPGSYLVRLLELEPIEDDTGKILSTKKRRQGIRFLDGEVRAFGTQVFRDKEGPIIELTVDAPARNATKIKSLTGKASISRSAFVRLQFHKLAEIDAKVLDHPKLKGFPIRSTIKVEDGYTILTLSVPKQHARLADWGLGQDGRFLPIFSESQSTEKDSVILEKTYRGDYTKAAFLGLSLVINEPNETKTLEFEFKNVELP